MLGNRILRVFENRNWVLFFGKKTPHVRKETPTWGVYLQAISYFACLFSKHTIFLVPIKVTIAKCCIAFTGIRHAPWNPWRHTGDLAESTCIAQSPMGLHTPDLWTLVSQSEGEAWFGGPVQAKHLALQMHIHWQIEDEKRHIAFFGPILETQGANKQNLSDFEECLFVLFEQVSQFPYQINFATSMHMYGNIFCKNNVPQVQQYRLCSFLPDLFVFVLWAESVRISSNGCRAKDFARVWLRTSI